MKLASPIRPAGLSKYGTFSPVPPSAQAAHDAAVAAFGARRPAGKPAGAVPEVLNASLVWFDERGHTRSDMAYCNIRFVADERGARDNPLCLDRNGAVIPPSSIRAATFRDAVPNPAFTPTILVPIPPVFRPDLPPAPTGCAAIPERITSQADVDAWNAAHPGCQPLPPFAVICAVPTPYPTTQTEADAWNADHPQCPAVTPQPAPRSWLGPAALAAAVVVAVVIVKGK